MPTHPFTRTIAFTIPGGIADAPNVQVSVVEVDGALQFTVQVLSTSTRTADLRGLFFDLSDTGVMSGLRATGSWVTDFASGKVIDLGQGANMQGAAKSFHVGVEFGTQGIGKDDVQLATFTLTNAAQDLTLDDIAQVNFGARLTSVGAPGGSRNDSAKLVALAPAAPDARNDAYTLFEDGQSGLSDPSTVPDGVVFKLLANDTDADGDTLTVTQVVGAAHGTVLIIDGDDADTLVGDAVLYTAFEDYSGPDSFYYAISDGHGGTDFAQVAVNVVAVADVPVLAYEILEGASVNQLVVRVTATQTDADDSETIDRLELSGLPQDVQVQAGALTAVGNGDQWVQDFVLTLPKYADTGFDLGVTAYAREGSNGDEESASIDVAIAYQHNVNAYEQTFEAEDQSMWGPGAAPGFEDDRFLGIDGADTDSYRATAGPGFFEAGYTVDYKLGFQSTLDISSGEVDATVPFEVEVTTLYNETTDWLRFETGAVYELLESSFSTMSPLLTYSLELIADIYAALHLAAGIEIGGTDAVEVAGVEIFPAIPGFSFSGGLDPSVDFAGSATLLEFDGDSLNLFGLEGDSQLTYDVAPGISLYAAIPHFDTDSTVAHGQLESYGSANFFGITADIDELVTKLLGLPVNPLGPSFSFGPVSVGIDLINYEITGSMGVGQEFFLDVGDLQGVLVFEDGFEYSFVLGSSFDVHDASSHDANLDGVLDFDLRLTPDAEFSSNLLLTLELTHLLEILKASASVSVPVFDDPEFTLGPLYEYEGVLAETQIEIVSLPSFSFDLGQQTVAFTV